MARVLKDTYGLPTSQSQELANLAQLSRYRVKTMAQELGCSCRWLEIQCHRQLALSPHAWLARLRTEEIQEQARRGAPAKVLCQLAGFADPASFCHGLKRCMGCTLRQLRKTVPRERSHNDNKNHSAPIPETRSSMVLEKSARCPHETLSLKLRHCGRRLEEDETAAPCWHNPVRASG
jgi:AraC-like DNA-binding protein